MCRFCLLTGDEEPSSGISARPPCTTSSTADWLEPDHCLAGVVGMRGTIPPPSA
jgi:Xaa-Pro aminopeptidase